MDRGQTVVRTQQYSVGRQMYYRIINSGSSHEITWKEDMYSNWTDLVRCCTLTLIVDRN